MTTPEHCCRSCGQPLPEMRLGVPMTALKARIFDIVRRAGPDGTAAGDLKAILGRPIEDVTIKVHVHQINELIADSEHRIVGRGGYRLVRCRLP
jgi:hypothetical protein